MWGDSQRNINHRALSRSHQLRLAREFANHLKTVIGASPSPLDGPLLARAVYLNRYRRHN